MNGQLWEIGALGWDWEILHIPFLANIIGMVTALKQIQGLRDRELVSWSTLVLKPFASDKFQNEVWPLINARTTLELE
jgi:hypothetical protein